MNQIKRLTKEQLINLGGSGYTKRDLVNNVERSKHLLISISVSSGVRIIFLRSLVVIVLKFSVNTHSAHSIYTIEIVESKETFNLVCLDPANPRDYNREIVPVLLYEENKEFNNIQKIFNLGESEDNEVITKH